MARRSLYVHYGSKENLLKAVLDTEANMWFHWFDLDLPVCGVLTEFTHIVVDLEGKSVEDIFGYPDDMKFRSSMTLFAQTTKG